MARLGVAFFADLEVQETFLVVHLLGVGVHYIFCNTRVTSLPWVMLASMSRQLTRVPTKSIGLVAKEWGKGAKMHQ